MDFTFGTGETFAILSALSWSIGAFIYGSVNKKISSFVINFLAAFSGLIFQLFVILFFGDFSKIFLVDLKIFSLIALVAITGYIIGRTLYIESIKLVGVSTALPLTSITPLFTFVLAVIFYNEVITPLLITGTVIIIIGVWLLNIQQNKDITERKNFRNGVLFAITAAMLWSISHVTIKYVLMYADIFYVNTIRITVQVTIMSIILIAQNKFLNLFKINVRDLVPISLGGIFSYFFYVVFFLSSLEMIGIARATPLSRIYPLFTFILAILFLKEKFTYVKLIGTIVIVSGVVLITI